MSREMAREMGLCHGTSGSWRVGDTMSSFSPTAGPGPSRPSPAGPATVDRLGPRAWLAPALEAAAGLPEPWPLPPARPPGRRPGHRERGGGRGSQGTDRRLEPPQPRRGRPAPPALPGAGSLPPLTHPPGPAPPPPPPPPPPSSQPWLLLRLCAAVAAATASKAATASGAAAAAPPERARTQHAGPAPPGRRQRGFGPAFPAACGSRFKATAEERVGELRTVEESGRLRLCGGRRKVCKAGSERRKRPKIQGEQNFGGNETIRHVLIEHLVDAKHCTRHRG